MRNLLHFLYFIVSQENNLFHWIEQNLCVFWNRRKISIADFELPSASQLLERFKILLYVKTSDLEHVDEARRELFLPKG